MLRHLAFAIALLAAGPAAALTCMRPEIANSFERADTRPEPFVIALGRLIRTGADVPGDVPTTGGQLDRMPYQFPARFEGRLAGANGFMTERGFDVTVEIGCISAWCGGESLSDYGLYFFRHDEQGRYALEANPCGGFLFENPTEHQLMEVLGLMR